MAAMIVPYSDDHAMDSARRALRSISPIDTSVQSSEAVVLNQATTSFHDVGTEPGLRGEGSTLQECEARLATCARLKRAHEAAYDAAVARREQAVANVQEAAHLLAALQEQERRCQAQCTSIVGSGQQQRWATKLLVLELKRDMAEGDLHKAQSELEKEQLRERAAKDQLRKSKLDAFVSFQALEPIRAASPLPASSHAASVCTNRLAQASPRMLPRRMRSEAFSTQGSPRTSPRRMRSEVPCSDVSQSVVDAIAASHGRCAIGSAQGSPRVSPRRARSEVSLAEAAGVANANDSVMTMRSPRLSPRGKGPEATPAPRRVLDSRPGRVSVGFGSGASTGRILRMPPGSNGSINSQRPFQPPLVKKALDAHHRLNCARSTAARSHGLEPKWLILGVALFRLLACWCPALLPAA